MYYAGVLHSTCQYREGLDDCRRRGSSQPEPAAVDLLRNGTGYGGPQFNDPVFTDDLSTMKAIEVPAVFDRLQAALDNGELNTAKIETSVLPMAAAAASDDPNYGKDGHIQGAEIHAGPNG